MAATHANATGHTERLEHAGHNLYKDNFYSSSALFDDLHTKTINCCGTVRPNKKGMLKNFGNKIKLKRGDIKTKVTCNFTTGEERQMISKQTDEYVFSTNGR